jgi:hypothetical protein
MVKIINSFTGSFLSLSQDFFQVMGVSDVSELVQLEAYTILVNIWLLKQLCFYSFRLFLS